jgi:hypothetical protein
MESSRTSVAADVPAELWISQPETAMYVASNDAARDESQLNHLPIMAGGGVAVIVMLLLRRQLASIAVSAFPLLSPLLGKLTTPSESEGKQNG